ncbi:hypothetical protein HK102_006465 [Quaeritorhiza haematococci]|nr:hypothetical protein HK102_006465 [Quaeritorhiza haematococci]
MKPTVASKILHIVFSLLLVTTFIASTELHQGSTAVDAAPSPQAPKQINKVGLSHKKGQSPKTQNKTPSSRNRVQPPKNGKNRDSPSQSPKSSRPRSQQPAPARQQPTRPASPEPAPQPAPASDPRCPVAGAPCECGSFRGVCIRARDGTDVCDCTINIDA